MSDKRYWIWLQSCLGAGASFKGIIEDFGSIEKLYDSNILERKMSPALTEKQIDRLESCSLNDTEKVIYECNLNGWDIIAFDDERYPQRLREIHNPPAVLYCDGEFPSFDRYAAIGIVGTRKASPYAMKAARLFAKGISLCGGVVISGGALGVDSAAHIGAVDANAKNYLILGCGLGTNYLKANAELRQRVKDVGGAIITEYQPFTPVASFNFPMRNRVISALSCGVIIVEAGVKSGSIITASTASEQGRDVFAIPASLFDSRFQGTNKLIEDGAMVATSVESVLKGYGERFSTLDLSKAKTFRELENYIPEANAPAREQIDFGEIAKDRAQRLEREEKSFELKGDENAVYRALCDAYLTTEEISNITGLDSKQVLASLTMLEIKGLAESTSGKRYRLK